MFSTSLQEISNGFSTGTIIPYLGPNSLLLEPETCKVPPRRMIWSSC